MQAGLGMGEGYSYQVAGGADLLSRRAIGGGLAGGLMGGLGIHANAVGDKAGRAVSVRILAESTSSCTAPAGSPAEQPRSASSTDHLVRGAYKGSVDAGGEFLKQVTDDKAGIDYGKIGGKAVGSGLAKPLPTGVSSPVGRGISAGVGAALG